MDALLGQVKVEGAQGLCREGMQIVEEMDGEYKEDETKAMLEMKAKIKQAQE